jgi:outer membrane protein OmpA-like peptidoglycan-associated protein
MLRTSLIANRASNAVGVLVPTLALVLLARPNPANADDFSLKLEPGVSESLTAPQSQIYATGGGQSLKALFGLTPYLDVGPSASFLFLPASAERAEAGVVWGFGAGIRFKLPHDRESYRGVSPWFDADLLYMRTGGLNRPGFDAAVGLAVPVGESRNFWVGPFVRYLHTVELERTGFDSRDAKTLIVGLSLEVGSGVERRRIPPALEEAPPVEPIAAATVACGDRDDDGIADNIDRCPDVAGLMVNDGCPNYDKLVVKKDKLELKEKLYFAWDKAKLEDASFPVLDEVVKALKDNLSFRVQVEGHTDSSGADAHNQTLSEQRAQAVLAYLTAHDVAQDRLVSKGFSSSVPLDTNDTVAGRENNRRVEFVVSFIILNDGSL